MKNAFLLILLLAVASTTAEAQRKAGRNGGAFLEIGVGAREVGLGSAVTSLANDANQIFWNPAGTALASDQTVSAAFGYNQWIADLDYVSAAVAYNLGNGGTVTIGAQMLGISDIPANRENGFSDPILQDLVTDTEMSSTYDYQDLAFSLAYARYFFDRLALGATVKYINESIDTESANALAFDFGSVYHVGLSGWQIAARINNLGTSMTFYNQDNPLPLTFSIGTSIYPINTEQTRLMLAVDAIKPMDSIQQFFGGAELSFYDLLFVRAGYKFLYSGYEDEGTSARDPINTSIEGISFGGGLQYDMGGTAFGADYAFTQMDLLDAVHRISLRIGL